MGPPHSRLLGAKVLGGQGVMALAVDIYEALALIST